MATLAQDIDDLRNLLRWNQAIAASPRQIRGDGVRSPADTMLWLPKQVGYLANGRCAVHKETSHAKCQMACEILPNPIDKKKSGVRADTGHLRFIHQGLKDFVTT